MRSKTGIACIILGAVLLLGAMLLAQFNRREDTAAKQAAMEVMPQLVTQIQERAAKDSTEPADVELQVPLELLTEEDKKMTEVEIDGHLYIGYISVPAVQIELPVMSSWSYPKLKIAPCRYTGSVRGEDMVLMAHNYSSHFKRISELKIGDDVFFTDMDGNEICYQVVGKDVLGPTAVEEMTAGDFDLTLFSCTYGGAARITIYCDRVN